MVKPVRMEDPAPWGRSTANAPYLEPLVAAGLLPAVTYPALPEWMAPGSGTEPRPSSGYIVSLAQLYERGFGVPAGRFVRALCHHYGEELHHFAPNAIS